MNLTASHIFVITLIVADPLPVSMQLLASITAEIR